MPTAAEVIHTIFTTANPVTGSQPPPQIAWVVFQHGTVFFSTPNDVLGVGASFDEIEDGARAALRELGPVHVGTPSADFNSVRLDSWYPDDPVWFIGFDHPAIVTILESDATDLVAGIEGRTRRQQDHDDAVIVLVRRFDGETKENH